MSGLTLFARVLRYKSLPDGDWCWPECVGKRVNCSFFPYLNLIAQKKLLHYKQNGSGVVRNIYHSCTIFPTESSL